MYPFSCLTNRVWSLKSGRLVALSAACLIAFVLVSSSKGAAGVNTSTALRGKDIRRAEKVLAKLRLLNEAGADRNDLRAFRALAGKLYPGLFITVADMRASDLKTDLDTAVFLYEEVGRVWPSADASTADCRREREDIYLPLCAGLRGGTARQLLLAKARLHARWAEAVINDYKGGGDAETIKTLSAVRAARGSDMVIAARAVETLRSLEGLVNIYPTYTDYPERRAAVSVGPDELDSQFTDVLGRAGLLIASLPRSPIFYHLSNAHHSYRDGLFWSRKIYLSRKLVVSARRPFDRDPLKDLGLDTESAGYVAVACWRKAIECSRLAEKSLLRAYKETHPFVPSSYWLESISPYFCVTPSW